MSSEGVAIPLKKIIQPALQDLGPNPGAMPIYTRWGSGLTEYTLGPELSFVLWPLSWRQHHTSGLSVGVYVIHSRLKLLCTAQLTEKRPYGQTGRFIHKLHSASHFKLNMWNFVEPCGQLCLQGWVALRLTPRIPDSAGVFSIIVSAGNVSPLTLVPLITLRGAQVKIVGAEPLKIGSWDFVIIRVNENQAFRPFGKHLSHLHFKV